MYPMQLGAKIATGPTGRVVAEVTAAAG